MTQYELVHLPVHSDNSVTISEPIHLDALRGAKLKEIPDVNIPGTMHITNLQNTESSAIMDPITSTKCLRLLAREGNESTSREEVQRLTEKQALNNILHGD